MVGRADTTRGKARGRSRGARAAQASRARLVASGRARRVQSVPALLSPRGARSRACGCGRRRSRRSHHARRRLMAHPLSPAGASRSQSPAARFRGVVGPEAGGEAFRSAERIQPPRVSVAVAWRGGPVVSAGGGKSARRDAGERQDRRRRCGPVRNRGRQLSRSGRFRRDAPGGMDQQGLAPASERACQGQVAGDVGRGRTLAA